MQKIEPKTIGVYGIAIAGSGNASLIDSLIVRAHRAIEKDTGNPTAGNLRTLLEDELADFQIKDVRACTDEDKRFQLFVAYYCATTKEHGVWISKNIVLDDLRKPAPNPLNLLPGQGYVYTFNSSCQATGSSVVNLTATALNSSGQAYPAIPVQTIPVTMNFNPVVGQSPCS